MNRKKKIIIPLVCIVGVGVGLWIRPQDIGWFYKPHFKWVLDYE